MRKLRGYIRRLSDGTAPPPGSVEVHARPEVDDLDIDATTHDLGILIVDHQVGGSGSATLADDGGSYGWQMELSPGKIDQTVIPSDPQVEYHLRFPDESSQVGMAFHSDIQRLGWAAGGDGVVWNAIPGGDDPSAASWSGGPEVTWNKGNGSIAAFGAGTATIRPFIGFLGGVLFSVEAGNLVCPTRGSAAPANATGQERWDVLEMVLNTDQSAPEYGRQSLEITPGTPGAGIPTPTAPTATERRAPLHAMLLPAGASTYTSGYDLRQWRGQQRAVISPPITKTWIQPGRDKWRNNKQTIAYGQSNLASVLNTISAADEILLPPATSYQGLAVWSAILRPLDGNGQDMNTLMVKIVSEGYNTAGALVSGTDYVISPEPEGIPIAVIQRGEHLQSASVMCPIAVIPAFDIFSQVSAASRSWSRLRFRVALTFNDAEHNDDSKIRIFRQSLTVSLWPVV